MSETPVQRATLGYLTPQLLGRMMRMFKWQPLAGIVLVGALSACSPVEGNLTSIITGEVPVDRTSETIEGTLSDVDGCASVALPGDRMFPIIWPGGFEILDHGTSVGDHHGRVRLGQSLSSKGYVIDRAELTNLSDPPAHLRGLDACSPEAATLVVFTQVEDFDSTE